MRSALELVWGRELEDGLFVGYCHGPHRRRWDEVPTHVETGPELGGDFTLEDQTEVFRKVGELAQSRTDPTRQLGEQGAADADVGNR